MSIIEKTVAELSDVEKIAVINDYEQFEKDGFIDDSFLRRTANKMIAEYDLSSSFVVMLMKDIAFECYRHFAHAHLWPNK